MIGTSCPSRWCMRQQMQMQFENDIAVPRSGQRLDGVPGADMPLMPHGMSGTRQSAVAGAFSITLCRMPSPGGNAQPQTRQSCGLIVSVAGPAALCRWVAAANLLLACCKTFTPTAVLFDCSGSIWCVWLHFILRRACALRQAAASATSRWKTCGGPRRRRACSATAPPRCRSTPAVRAVPPSFICSAHHEHNALWSLQSAFDAASMLAN